ncbi:MAG TPA: acyl-CoA dehydrogenase family protein [Acidimicrobiia bacterium]|nr:acyl-CoA dehydrogenase family protein [Acidimicrobiia bacterium]
MDFELSDDQLALREAARDLLDDLAGPAQVRAVVDGPAGIDAKLWQAMVDQGWLGVELAEDRGGLGLGTVEAAVLLEELGGHVAPVPFLQQWLALDSLVTAAAAGVSEVEAWIEPLTSGERIATVAWQPVIAEGSGVGWSLTGRTEPAVFAPTAAVAVVRSDDALFAVDLDGAAPARQPAMDRTRELGWLEFEGTSAVRLGADDAVARFLDRGAMGHSAEMLGGAQRMLDMAVEYAKERVQFDRPIGSFQAVKHRCADMLVDVEGMRSAVYYAAWCIGAGHPDASVAASTAKTWCSDAARRVMGSGLQVHGGIGFTWEHDTHLFLKRSQLDQVSFGDAVFHRARLAALLRPRVEAGESVV